jgi:putative transposase
VHTDRTAKASYGRRVTRQLRSDLPDGIFHVTARGVDGTVIFLDDTDRLRFLDLYRQSVERHDWLCHTFCLMTNHYHLVVEAARAAVSAGIHRLNGLHAQRFNRCHRRTGHLFGDRFSSWVIEDEEHLTAACEYVLHNPVRAGLCERPEDWPWSGIRHESEHLFAS